MSDEHISKASALGREHGYSAGTWVIDGNTSEETAKAIIAGYEDGDPQVMDMQPSPLSGEWADDLGPYDLVYELDIPDTELDEGHIPASILDAYEEGFSEAYWAEVIHSARAIL